MPTWLQSRRRWLVVLVAVLVVLVLFASRIATFYTEILWYRSVGFSAVYWSLLGTRVGLGVAAGLVALILVGGNLLLARRLAPPYRLASPAEEVVERYRRLVEPYARLALAVVAVFVAIVAGTAVVGNWNDFLLWSNAVPFGQPDPHFGRDIGYFVFVLPFHVAVNSWLFGTLVAATVFAALAHYLFGGIRPQSPGQKVTPKANVHLSVLLALVVAVRGWGFVLNQYLLSYSPRGQVTGLSYTDANAQLRAYQLLAVIAAVCVVLFLANIVVRGWLLPSAGLGILVVAALILSGLYPAAIQRFQVAPQELAREEPYIERNLELTRFAYGLGDDHVEYEPFPARATLVAAQLNANSRTLDAIRLWDPTTLQNSYTQLQEFRPYYDFHDVDVDRYELDGSLRQVNIAVREISESDLSSRTWQNRRLLFTHGYGLVSSSVSQVGPDGRPAFLVQNIPLEGEEELLVPNPRIYFGERLPEYSIVGTSADELDYPIEGGQETFRYDGQDGVVLSSLTRRVAFALRFAEPNIVLSSLISDESRMLFHRDVHERLEAVAPFLTFDHDPYPVVVGETVKWIVDGYTVTDMVPYSERVELSDLTRTAQRRLVTVQLPDGSIEVQERLVSVAGISGRANYIRNSVKAVVDAYEGTVTLYVVDPDDPLIQAWGRAFPDVLTPLDQAPEGILAHFRYPEDMFRVQSELLRAYHIQGAADFYSRQDLWALPNDAAFFANQFEQAEAERSSRTVPPNYQLLRLPGEESEQFTLVQPFTPAALPVLSAYVAGRTGPRGEPMLRVLQMPPNRTVLGTEQAFATINQDDAVSQQITLWNESGSRVIYGNLLVVPIEDSLLYVLPLFLRAEQSDIPQLRKVVLLYGEPGEQVIMANSLPDALFTLFGARPPDVAGEPDEPGPTEPGPTEPGPPEPGPGVTDPRVAGLIERALEAFEAADEALRVGDLGEYQEQTREAQRLLEEAQALLDGESPAD